MARVIENVCVATVTEYGNFTPRYDHPIKVEVIQTGSGAQINFYKGADILTNLPVVNGTEFCRVGRLGLLFSRENDPSSLMLRFQSENDMRALQTRLSDLTSKKKSSVFSERTDQASATQYFQFYSYLSQQQNMLQDYVRTSTYQKALLANMSDLSGKVVLDVGAGSGILSFFAVQAGARKVYAVEASSMAQHCERLIHHNGMSDKIVLIPGKIEEVELPESVDAIISEPIGYMLFNERMLESYLHAKKWLRPGGRMFPTQGDLYIAPFQDESLYMEQTAKANFWHSDSFYCVDLTCLRTEAFQEYFKQPIVDTFDIRICMAHPFRYSVNFETCHETDLHVIHVPLSFTINSTGTIHGLAFWFDLAFIGSSETIWLSTAPTEQLTHWYQVRCLLLRPVIVKQGQHVTGHVTLRSNSRQSYDVDISIDIPNTTLKSTNSLDLKNPYFRYTGIVPPAPPQHSTVSPTEQYYNSVAASTAGTIPNVMYNGFTNGGGAPVPEAAHMHLSPHQIQPHMAMTAATLGGDILMNSTLLNASAQQQQLPNLAPLANSSNASCAPSVMIGNNVGSVSNRSLVGGGINPNVFTQVPANGGMFGINNLSMMADYMATNGGVGNGMMNSAAHQPQQPHRINH